MASDAFPPIVSAERPMNPLPRRAAVETPAELRMRGRKIGLVRLSATPFPLEMEPTKLIQKGRSDAYSLPLREHDEPRGAVSFDVECRTERDVADRLAVDDADKVRRRDGVREFQIVMRLKISPEFSANLVNFEVDIRATPKTVAA